MPPLAALDKSLSLCFYTDSIFIYLLFNRLLKEKCGQVVMPPCDALSDVLVTSRLLHDAIKRARFKGADGRSFHFTDAGDGSSRYSVLNYQIQDKLVQKTGFHVVSRILSAFSTLFLFCCPKNGDQGESNRGNVTTDRQGLKIEPVPAGGGTQKITKRTETCGSKHCPSFGQNALALNILRQVEDTDTNKGAYQHQIHAS